MKKQFLQARVAPVNLDAEPPPGHEDRRYESQLARGFLRLSFESSLEAEYRGQRRHLWVERAYSLVLAVLSVYLVVSLQATAEWGLKAVVIVLGWLAFYLAAWQSRHGFLQRGELRQQAQVDGLTGALNRRAFFQHLSLIWRQAERERRAIGLMLVDMDHFKQLNDRHGHVAGDVALRTTAQILKSYALRPFDAVGRYGGDEFIVAWYDAQPQSFAQLVQLLPAKLWMGLAATDIRDAEMTVSGGALLARPDEGMTIEQAVQLADEELYRVKRGYRGSISLAHSTLPALQRSLPPSTVRAG